jgi:hypothetical protein
MVQQPILLVQTYHSVQFFQLSHNFIIREAGDQTPASPYLWSYN